MKLTTVSREQSRIVTEDKERTRVRHQISISDLSWIKRSLHFGIIIITTTVVAMTALHTHTNLMDGSDGGRYFFPFTPEELRVVTFRTARGRRVSPRFAGGVPRVSVPYRLSPTRKSLGLFDMRTHACMRACIIIICMHACPQLSRMRQQQHTALPTLRGSASCPARNDKKPVLFLFFQYSSMCGGVCRAGCAFIFRPVVADE